MHQELQFKKSLRIAGERVTTPRVIIFRILSRYSPLPMARLISKASESGVDPVTIYRTVDLFKKLGFVQEVGLGRNRLFELSDNYHNHHHHFTCTNCGKITDFDSEIIEKELHTISEALGIRIQSHQLETSGLCASCASKQQ